MSFTVRAKSSVLLVRATPTVSSRTATFSSSTSRGFASAPNGARFPPRVGILAMDTYFPKTFVSQKDLEAHDGVSEGKYTVGLGQSNMAFVDEREDITSICASAVHNLMEKFRVSPKDIGRLEIGTETVVDKSKSVKTALMDIFAAAGNSNVEGIDTTNACYGGTSALFNALQWIESSYWDGRYAIVVAGDIAVYEKGPARPTGGCGAVAMLVGPNAPLVFERGLRSTYMENAYDFYKPVLPSEYPLVDGKLSNDCYIRALDRCFERYADAFDILAGGEENSKKRFSLDDDFDHAIFHSPYTKLVQKSWARMHYLDFVRGAQQGRNAAAESGLAAFLDKDPADTYDDRQLAKVAMDETKDSYKHKVTPSLLLGKELGNSYCGSLYCGIHSLVESRRSALVDKRVGLFSYGSGLAASLFSMRVESDPTYIAEATELPARLAARTKASPEQFERALERRERYHAAAPFVPPSTEDDLFAGSYRLAAIDDKYRRAYARKGRASVAATEIADLPTFAVSASQRAAAISH